MTLSLQIALDADHQYTVNSVPVAGVTGTIGSAGLGDWRFVKEYYRDRGSRAHKAMHYAVENDLDLGSCPDDVVGYVVSMQDFLQRHRAATIAVEKRVYHPTLKYAGTLDWLGLLDSCGDVTCCAGVWRSLLSLLDWKTSKTFHPATAIQTIAYADALYEETRKLVDRRMCVLVDEDGGQAKVKVYDVRGARRERELFRAALIINQWRRENGIDSIYDPIV